MLNVEIRRPKIEEINEINQFFRKVITDTFTKEGIGEKLDDIENEIEIKKKYLASDFESHGAERYFLIAIDSDRIIGTIECGLASDLIGNCTNNAYKGLLEVGTVFVHPDYQRMGIGNRLLKAMYFALQDAGKKEFCLDSGYKSAQTIWKKKFGYPDYLLKDYWDEDYDHMIWKIRVIEWI
ncbi:GNAT family N-acetyltransferase [Paenibacillus sp. BSR1-1]|uniref:GNAT family N-acetyltransferase n=1 Tax=Paenibacillus sp. BSR1-1 TaxID=3020845 RepID=UPI0025B10F68|nr:GNAT family N-acetyltransferase [Paenibacillus sp. BSR1-1]MDN3018271.1 GNAT family N-acetyltransferase [Paenibacillus sp. BSR1-1]